MAKRRSCRLRKKLRLGEFQQLGFETLLRFRPELTDAEQAAFFDAFLAEAIEASGLTFGGWEAGFVAPVQGSASEAQREAVRAWLAARPELAEFAVGPLIDAWYPAPHDTVALPGE